jgi:hypothetical protein
MEPNSKGALNLLHHPTIHCSTWTSYQRKCVQCHLTVNIIANYVVGGQCVLIRGAMSWSIPLEKIKDISFVVCSFNHWNTKT